MIVAIIRNSARNSSRFMKNTRSYADAFITKRDSVPFSRFPVPQTNELPADIKEKFDTVLEKVRTKSINDFCASFFLFKY